MKSKFKETLTDLRRMKREGKKLTRSQGFRLLSSRCAKRFHKTGWSSTERRVARVLNELGLQERRDFWHNYKIHNRNQNQFYSLDFVFFHPNRVIEVSPRIWHLNLGNTEEKDARKKEWLEYMGFQYYELDDEYLEHKKGNKKRLKDKLISILKIQEEMTNPLLKGST